jgi:alpha-D-xyloside xylohydrolase
MEKKKRRNYKLGMVTKVVARYAASIVACAAMLLPVTRLLAAPRFSVEHDDNEVRITTYDGILAIRPLTDNAIRVRYSIRPVDAESRIILPDLPPANFHITQSPDSVTVSTPAMSAVADLTSGLVSFYGSDGRLLVTEEAGSRKVTASTTGGEACMSVADAFALSEGEYLYGTGQFQDGELVLNNLPRKLVQVNTQIAIPFVLSNRGYGILWHNYGATEFNMAAGKMPFETVKKTGRMKTVYDWNDGNTTKLSREIVEYTGRLHAAKDARIGLYLESGPQKRSEATLEIDGRVIRKGTGSVFADLGVGDHVLKISATGGDPSLYIRTARNDFTLASPVADSLDYIVFEGKKPADVVAAYRSVTGAAPLLPEWAYGFIQCRERYETQKELLDSLSGFRSRDLPMDLIVQDWQYWGSHGWNAMRFDSRYFPDPAWMVRKVHDSNAHIMISVWSKIGVNTTLGKEFTAKNYYIKGTKWVDFTNPDAAAAYWAGINKAFNSIGFDAWWLDATEPEDDAMVGRQIFAGSSDRYRNLYPELVSKTVYEGQRASSPDKRVFILTRSAFAGQQRYASSVWSGDITGDWDTFRRQIPAGLNYVACGLPYWTTDCGGFMRPKMQYTDVKYHELLTRWLEFATFCPLQRIHGEHSETEPWNYGRAMEKEMRRWLNLRYRLLPYVYSTAADVTSKGASLMEPLVMDYPDDEKALNARYEFMFGPAFLVAPVVEPGAKIWKVYLPKNDGGWYDFFYGKPYAGGKSVSVDTPVDYLPLFVKAGSIIPMGPQVRYANEKPASPIELRVYPGADAEFVLYEDDGTTYGYEKGASSRIVIRWVDDLGTLTISAREGEFPGMLKSRKFNVVKIGAGFDPIEANAKSVDYDGSEVKIKL